MNSINDPWTFADLWSTQQVYVSPGDTILLRGGSYATSYTSTLAGKTAYPITLKAYPDEAPILQSYGILQGRSLILENLIIHDADFLTRTTALYGPTPADIPTHGGLVVQAQDVYIRNCIIHDCRDGILGAAAEIYGCIIYHCGWNYISGANSWGHAVYSSNPTTSAAIIRNNIIFGGYGYGVHVYGSGQPLNNYTVEDNIIFESGMLRDLAQSNILVGGEGGSIAVNPILRRNCTYFSGTGTPNKLGMSAGATGAIIEDNYMPEGLTKGNVVATSETGNYYGPGIGDVAFVKPNAYNANRAHLAIYNENELDTVEVDVSSLGWTGQVSASAAMSFNPVTHIYDDVQTLDIIDGAVTVNAQAINRTVAAPQGDDAPPTTFPQFGAFVLERVL